ncbi:MAG: DUF882 domain-containing protein [Bacterioplanes sp.]|nr:DUF882 domain-containing protein [Bacterioplanes sp.]
MKEFALNRRHFLQQASLLGAGISAGIPLTAHAQPHEERTLRLYNIHTGESLQTTFWANGAYLDDEIQTIDLLMRDHRANQAIAMQRELYQRLYELQQLFNAREPLYIVSAYRSPSTNQRLRQQSSGVAQTSMHIQGKAIDVRIPGVSHRHLHKAALAMHAGGVGYYPKSGYIHLDTGRNRHWIT